MTEKDKSFYLLLDAMGIQNYVFETNTLKIIEGSSYLLAKWQLDCKNKASAFGGEIIASVGGNILARFSQTECRDEFRTLAITIAPPGLQIAWACSNTQGNDYETWNCLQLEISRYKAGDQDDGSYEPILKQSGYEPEHSPWCQHCGARVASVKDKKGRYICSICRTKSENGGSAIANNVREKKGTGTMIEALYKTAMDMGYADGFPNDLESLVSEAGNDKEDMLAVIVIDLNGLGNKGKEKVKNEGFEGFGKFAAGVENAIAEILKDLVTCLAEKKEGKVENKFVRMIPLFIGGDDIAIALPMPMWQDFVTSFFSKLKEITVDFSAAAGVSIAKHTYPMSRLIEMAEELVGNAKKLSRYKGNNESAIDWHIHYESGYTSISSVRKREYVDSPTSSKAYQVSTKRPYTADEFLQKTEQANCLSSGNPNLSNRKLFVLHQALRSGKEATRNVLVYDFLRNENSSLDKYKELWELVETTGSEALWDKKVLCVDGSPFDFHFTEAADILELKLMKDTL